MFYIFGCSVMNIQQITNYNDYSNPSFGKGGNNSAWKKFKQKIVNIFPEKTFENKVEKWDKFNHFMAKPAENRAIMGVTALITQPFIDYYNHKVDEETREVSRNRTIAKIVAGTTVGIAVRELCYRLVNSTTKPDELSKFSKKLLPKEFISEIAKNPTYLKNYRNALSTMVALFVMTFTNFLLDAPFTVFLTNKLNDKTQQAKADKEFKKSPKGGIR